MHVFFESTPLHRVVTVAPEVHHFDLEVGLLDGAFQLVVIPRPDLVFLGAGFEVVLANVILLEKEFLGVKLGEHIIHYKKSRTRYLQ